MHLRHTMRKRTTNIIKKRVRTQVCLRFFLFLFFGLVIERLLDGSPVFNADMSDYNFS